MSIRTPIKKHSPQKSPLSSIGRSSQRNSFKKRQYSSVQETIFNPRLYISNYLNEKDVMLIKQAFDHHDTNGTGILTPNDLKVALIEQNFHASKETVYSIIAQFDEECLGGLNFAAFIRIIGSDPREIETKHEIKKIFRKYDKQNKGYISQQNLEQVFKSCGQILTSKEMAQIMSRIDKKGNGKIDLETFCQIMHHPDSIY